MIKNLPRKDNRLRMALRRVLIVHSLKRALLHFLPKQKPILPSGSQPGFPQSSLKFIYLLLLSLLQLKTGLKNSRNDLRELVRPINLHVDDPFIRHFAQPPSSAELHPKSWTQKPTERGGVTKWNPNRAFDNWELHAWSWYRAGGSRLIRHW